MINKRSALSVAALCATIGAASAQDADDVLVGSKARPAQGLWCVVTNLSPTEPITIKTPTVVDDAGDPFLPVLDPKAKQTYGMLLCFEGAPPQSFTINPNNTCYMGFFKDVPFETDVMLTCKMFVDKRKFFRGYVNTIWLQEFGSTEIE